MDILNFISWIKAGKYSKIAPIDAVTVIGVPNPTRGDAYLPVTVPISALQTNIGKYIGGGIVVSEWYENGVHKALIVSLFDLSIGCDWTVPAQQGTFLFGAVSISDGLGNTNAIILQTGAAATINYAAGIARLFNDSGFTDWYLPSMGELTICYNLRAILNKVLTSIGQGNGFGGAGYWSSTGLSSTGAFLIDFSDGTTYLTPKGQGEAVRAVRTHTF